MTKDSDQKPSRTGKPSRTRHFFRRHDIRGWANVLVIFLCLLGIGAVSLSQIDGAWAQSIRQSVKGLLVSWLGTKELSKTEVLGWIHTGMLVLLGVTLILAVIPQSMQRARRSRSQNTALLSTVIAVFGIYFSMQTSESSRLVQLTEINGNRLAAIEASLSTTQTNTSSILKALVPHESEGFSTLLKGSLEETATIKTLLNEQLRAGKGLKSPTLRSEIEAIRIASQRLPAPLEASSELLANIDASLKSEDEKTRLFQVIAQIEANLNVLKRSSGPDTP